MPEHAPVTAPVADMVGRYLTPAETAEYLRMSLSWVRKVTRAGALPHADLGWRIVYDREDLDEFVRQRKVAAAWDARDRRRDRRRSGSA